MYTPKFCCPHCKNEQSPTIEAYQGDMPVGSLFLCGCAESLKEEERKHRVIMEARKKQRSSVPRRKR